MTLLAPPWWTDAPLVQRLGLTLAHTVWQAAAAAAVTWVALLLVRRTARVRYAIATTMMAAVVAAAGVTFAVVGERRPTPVSIPIRPAVVPAVAVVVPPTVAVRPVERKLDGRTVTALLVLLWAGGVTTQAAWQAVGWTRVRRLGRSPAVADRRWTATLEAVSARVGLRRPVRLLASAAVDVPVVLGAWRPAVVVPVSLLTGLPADHIAAVLAHELAHVRRHDYLVNLLQCGVEAVFFYHPAVWWLSAVVRREREHCCDDAAATAVDSRPTVAAALVAVEERRGPRLAVAITGRSSLPKRVRRLLTVERPRRRATPAWAAVAVIAVGVGLAVWGRPPSRAKAQVSPATRPSSAPTSRAAGPAASGPSRPGFTRDRMSGAKEARIELNYWTLDVAYVETQQHRLTELGRMRPLTAAETRRQSDLNDELTAAKAQVASLQRLVAVDNPPRPAATTTAQTRPATAVPPAVSTTAEVLKLLQAERARTAAELADADARGLGPAHPQRVQLQRKLDAYDDQIRRLAVVDPAGDGRQAADAKADTLRALLQRNSAELKSLLAKADRDGRDAADAEQVGRLRAEQAQIRTRLDQLALEPSTPAVMAMSPPATPSPVTPPEVPPAPTVDVAAVLGDHLRNLLERRAALAKQVDEAAMTVKTLDAAGVAANNPQVIRALQVLDLYQQQLNTMDGQLVALRRRAQDLDAAARRYTGDVYVGGTIGRPGVYAITDGHRTPVSRIVIAAGDVPVEAGGAAWITVSRRVDGRQVTVLNGVPFKSLLDGSAADPDLWAGDVVRVSTVDPAVAAAAKAAEARDAAAAKLWHDVYEPQVIEVNGRPVNEEPVRAAWRRAVDAAAATQPSR